MRGSGRAETKAKGIVAEVDEGEEASEPSEIEIALGLGSVWPGVYCGV